MSLLPLPNLVKRRFLLALLASSVVPFSTAKAFTEIYDQTDFLATFTDPSEYTTETFSSLSNGEQSTFSMSFTNFTLSTTETDGNGFWKSNAAGGPWLGTLAPGETLTLSFSTGAQAAGMFISLTDIDDVAQSGVFQIQINGGGWFDRNTDDHPYLGIRATDALIQTVEIKTTSLERWVTVAAVTVPEPSTYLLFGTSAVAFLALKRRRQASRG